VYFALAGGIDVFTNERVKSPREPSEKIDAAQPHGLIGMILPPLMHGAGQMTMYRMLFEGNAAILPAAFDAEETWRLVEKHRVNMIGVTGDAMARPLADALEKMKDDVDVSSLVSFSSTAAIFSQSVKEHGTAPEYS
jgi:acyl-CoA synthetase (AMP-forming)/AMP-acid ligase II